MVRPDLNLAIHLPFFGYAEWSELRQEDSTSYPYCHGMQEQGLGVYMCVPVCVMCVQLFMVCMQFTAHCRLTVSHTRIPRNFFFVFSFHALLCVCNRVSPCSRRATLLTVAADRQAHLPFDQRLFGHRNCVNSKLSNAIHRSQK